MNSSQEFSAPAQLLVFTLGARGECDRRRLLPSRLSEWELAFHQRCIESVLLEGRKAGFELAISSPSRLAISPQAQEPAAIHQLNQHGGSFGERLTNAVRAVETDRRPLVVVGTDSPELAGCHLEQAVAELDHDPTRVVIGPAADGGFYLLASAQPISDELERVRWCRTDTLESLLEVLQAAGRSVVLLPELVDIDRSSDFEAWLKRAKKLSNDWTPLVSQLLERLAIYRRPLFGWDDNRLPSPPPRCDLARAPPAA